MLLGEAISPELLIRAVSSTLSRAAKSKRSEALAGPVVNLDAVREARAPVTVGYVTLTPSNDALAIIDELAYRVHGEANQTTRAIVLEQALIRGLSSMQQALDAERARSAHRAPRSASQR